MTDKTPTHDALKNDSPELQPISHTENAENAVLCDRCLLPMFRMRAVYWCVNCGYKTDCCGH